MVLSRCDTLQVLVELLDTVKMLYLPLLLFVGNIFLRSFSYCQFVRDCAGMLKDILFVHGEYKAQRHREGAGGMIF